MPPGQGPLDAFLARQQPVHGRVQFVLLHGPEGKRPGQRIARGGLGQVTRGGQLGARVEHPSDDHRQHPVAFGGALRGDEPLQAQFPERAEGGGDMAVRAGAHDVEGLLEPHRGGAALEQDAQALDQCGGAIWRDWRGCVF